MKRETRSLLEKADRSIRNSERTLSDGDLDFAASRAYYAMFYIAEALLGEKNLQFTKHGGVHGAFSQHFVKTGDFDVKYQRWLVSAFSQRILGDYTIAPEFNHADVQELIDQAREFLEAAKNILK